MKQTTADTVSSETKKTVFAVSEIYGPLLSASYILQHLLGIFYFPFSRLSPVSENFLKIKKEKKVKDWFFMVAFLATVLHLLLQERLQ